MPLLLVLLTGGAAVGGENGSLRLENQRLETELRIAQTRQVYAIFDLQNKKILLKARGVLLKELPIEAFRVWGNLPAVTAAGLVRKSALFAPKRVVVTPKPGEEQAQPSEETFELKDMPTSFTLVLDGNMSISVRPKPTRTLSRLWSIRYPIQWYLGRPILTVWHALRKQPYTSIEIVLEEGDARSLYWSFLEGMKGIVVSPGNPS